MTSMMDKKERTFSTSGQGEFCMHPPKFAQRLKPQEGCTCLDKLVDEERERHAKNIAFQKALVKRIEASERRISYDGDEDDDDDEDDEPRGRRGGKRRRKEAAPAATPVAQPGFDSLPPIKPPTVKPPFDTDKCICYKKIIVEERKRKKFVRNLERQQRRYEKKTLKAQRKYEKERAKAFRKCDDIQNKIDKQYGMNDRTVKINQGDEMYSVFLHMDPGECGCNFRERCFTKFKKCFFKFCVWFYIIGFIVAFAVYYFLTGNFVPGY